MKTGASVAAGAALRASGYTTGLMASLRRSLIRINKALPQQADIPALKPPSVSAYSMFAIIVL